MFIKYAKFEALFKAGYRRTFEAQQNKDNKHLKGTIEQFTVNFFVSRIAKGKLITGRNQTFCIFEIDGNTFKVSCQYLADRKQDIFRMKSNFTSSSWRNVRLGGFTYP